MTRIFVLARMRSDPKQDPERSLIAMQQFADVHRMFAIARITRPMTPVIHPALRVPAVD